ncbi:MAG: hypothetical protein RL726_64 [Actinomycetota bacterium]|jgi:hypothetical protein
MGPRRISGLVVLTSIGLLLVSCSSESTPSPTINVEDPTTTVTADTTSDTTVAPDTAAPDTAAPVEFPMVRGSRYCELLFLRATEAGIQATVYGTQGLSYCPQADWDAIDTAPLAAEMEALFVMRNGPRGWLVDSVQKDDVDASERRTFGDLEMNRLAVVDIADPSTVGRPYTWQEVDRRTVFTFAAGSTEFFLTDSDGNRYVMQAFSQQVDPSMSEETLAGLGDRLTLPEGWTYSVETIDEDLVIETMDTPARVLQDEFMNSYSWIPTP